MIATSLPRTLITLPLLALGLAVLSAGHAAASGKAAGEAVRLLTSARAADLRCNYLSAAERAELSRYAARAEVAAASQSGVAVARKAAAAGMTEGGAATCSAELEADIRETLAAAREAVAQATSAGAGQTVPVSRPAQPDVGTAAQAPSRDRRMQRRVTGSLTHYEQAVRAYYLERECRSLPKAAARQFWKGIVQLHKATVAALGAARVAPVMREAERRARTSSCGARALAEIRQGYREIVSR